ncbi:hypothetical protein HQQ81_10335 [Microbacteriaceae bacterium VKM Ac-2854]|nr:hypothetical protein [Microbacteriaceae bacterium VKM Ac-2854]
MSNDSTSISTLSAARSWNQTGSSPCKSTSPARYSATAQLMDDSWRGVECTMTSTTGITASAALTSVSRRSSSSALWAASPPSIKLFPNSVKSRRTKKLLFRVMLAAKSRATSTPSGTRETKTSASFTMGSEYPPGVSW